MCNGSKPALEQRCASDIDYAFGIEPLRALFGVAAWVADDAGFTAEVVLCSMNVAMHPERDIRGFYESSKVDGEPLSQSIINQHLWRE